MTSTTDAIQVWRQGHTLVVAIDRPATRNALTWDAIREIGRTLSEAAEDSEVRAAVLTGEGEAFCSGGDLGDQRMRADWPLSRFVTSADPLIASIEAIWDFPKPLLAAVNGVAVAAGAGLALLADVRLASPSARLGFPFARVGLVPDFGVSWTLPRLVGPGQAARLLFSASMLDAREAKSIGLVDVLVEDEPVLDAALKLAAQISGLAPLGIRLAKASLRRAHDMPFAQAIATEMTAQHIARSTNDHREGLAAFLERRPPAFQGD